MTLIFKKHYINKIVGGGKIATRRVSRPMVKPDGIYRLRTDFFEYLPDRIRVLRIYTQRLGDIPLEDALREGVASLEEFRREWTEIYKPWDDDQTVWVVEFEYLDPTESLKQPP